MELNVFTQQLEQCYNILSQQFIIIKQLKDLTIKDGTNDIRFNEIDDAIFKIENGLTDSNTPIYKHTMLCNSDFELILYSFGKETSTPITLDKLKDITKNDVSNYIISNCGTVNANGRHGVLCLTYDKDYEDTISLKLIESKIGGNNISSYSIGFINSDTVTQIR